MGVRNLIEITPSTEGETWEVIFACQSIGVIELVKDESQSFAKWLWGQTEYYGVKIDGKPLRAFSTLKDAIGFIVEKHLDGKDKIL